MRPTELTVRNEREATRVVRATLDAIADECGLGAEERFDLKVAATEAVTNALKGAAADRTVDVRITPGERAIEVEVADRGVFAPRFTADTEAGRGIPLMLALVDEIEFAAGVTGTRVRMRKRFARAGEEQDLNF